MIAKKECYRTVKKRFIKERRNAIVAYAIYAETESDGRVWYKAYRNGNKEEDVCVKTLDMCERAVENLISDSYFRIKNK